MTIKEFSKYNKKIEILLLILSIMRSVLFLIFVLVWLIGGNILYVLKKF